MPRFLGEAAVNVRSLQEANSNLQCTTPKPPPGLFEPMVTPLLAVASPAGGATVLCETDAHGSEAGGSSCCSTTNSLTAVGVVAAASHLQKQPGDPALAEHVGQKPHSLLSQNDAMPEAFVLGSAVRPTVGSSYHHLGLCKPCAHAFSNRGCWNGVNCEFCHLCERGELKRRQLERRAFKRAVMGIVRLQR